MGGADFLAFLHDGQNAGVVGGGHGLVGGPVLGLADVFRVGSETLCGRHHPVDIDGETLGTGGTGVALWNGFPWGDLGRLVVIVAVWCRWDHCRPAVAML